MSFKSNLLALHVPPGETEAHGYFWFRLSRGIVSLLIITYLLCSHVLFGAKCSRYGDSLKPQPICTVGIIVCILHKRKLGFREANNLFDLVQTSAGIKWWNLG